ncbi:MAG: anti-sigma factor [Deltaproteobacteria bacterium]
MGKMQNHERFTELVPLYALGALDGDDLRDLWAHLKNGCPACEKLLWECEEAAAQGIAGSASLIAPPESLGASIVGRIGASATRPLPQAPPASSLWERLGPALFKFAAGAAAFGFIVYFYLSTLSLRDEIEEQNEEIAALKERLGEQTGGQESLKSSLSKKDGEIAKLREQLSAQIETTKFLSGSKVVVINLTGSQPNYKSSGKVLWDTKTNEALFIGSSLPNIPPGKTYQLWAVTDSAAVSVAVFKVDVNGNNSIKFESVSTPERVQKFAVSLEPEGGAPKPTGEIYLAGML